MFLYSLDGDALFGPFINEVDVSLAVVEKLKTMTDVKVVAIFDDDIKNEVKYNVGRSTEDDRTIITLTEV